MTMTRRDSLTGLLRVAAAALIWGTIPLVLRSADGASVIKVFYRVLFGGVVLAGVDGADRAARRGHRPAAQRSSSSWRARARS